MAYPAKSSMYGTSDDQRNTQRFIELAPCAVGEDIVAISDFKGGGVVARFISEICPLCRERAGYIVWGTDRDKYFDCPKCMFFWVANAVEPLLPNIPQRLRDVWSARSSKAPISHRLVITRCVDESHSDQLQYGLLAIVLPKSQYAYYGVASAYFALSNSNFSGSSAGQYE